MLAASVVVFFLVDETCDEGALRDLLVAARDAVPLLPPDALVGLLSFGRAVSVYLLAQPASVAEESSPIEALTLPASDAPLPWELEALIARAAHALAPRHACYTRLLRAFEALHPPPPPPTFARRPALGSSASSTSTVSSAEPARGLLAAIDIASALLSETSKIDVPSVVVGTRGPSAVLGAAAVPCCEMVITLAGAPIWDVARSRRRRRRRPLRAWRRAWRRARPPATQPSRHTKRPVSSYAELGCAPTTFPDGL